MARNFSVALSLLLNSAQYTQALRGAANTTNSFRNGIVKAFLPIAGIAALGVAIKSMISTVFEQTKKLDSLDAGYKSVITNSDELAKTYATLGGMAENYGTSINTLKTEYLAFAAASKGTSLEGKEAMKVFDALTFSMGKLGASDEATHRALVAVTQMMSKGTVASEELRGQLGEALPGAFNLAAKAMGVSTMQLGKMLKLGDVVAADMLPKLADQLNKTYRPDHINRIDTLTAAQGRYSTALTELIDQLKAGDIFQTVIDSGTKLLKLLGEIANTETFKEGVKEIARILDETLYVAFNKNLSIGQKLGFIFDDLNGVLGGGKNPKDRAAEFFRTAKAVDELAQGGKNATEAIGNTWQNLKKLNDAEFGPKKPKEVIILTDEQKEKAAKEAFEKETNLLEKHKNEQLIIITDQLREGAITEGIFKESEIQASIEFYKKQIDLLKKFGKDSTAVQLQLSQERSKLMDVALMKRKDNGPVKSQDPNVEDPKLQGVFSAERILAQRQKERDAIEKAGQDRQAQVDDLNSQLANGIGSMVSQTGAAFGESIGKVLGGMDASEAFSGFGNSILQMIGQFLVSLGSALITYGIIMSAFFADMDPMTKIAIGGMAVVAGGILMGIASAGPSGSPSMGAGGGSSSSPGGSYNSPGSSQAINITGQFEVSGNNLVAVLGNQDKRNKNFR